MLCQVRAQPFEQFGSVVRPASPHLLMLDDPPASLPIGGGHHRIHGSGGPCLAVHVLLHRGRQPSAAAAGYSLSVSASHHPIVAPMPGKVPATDRRSASTHLQLRGSRRRLCDRPLGPLQKPNLSLCGRRWHPPACGVEAAKPAEIIVKVRSCISGTSGIFSFSLSTV